MKKIITIKFKDGRQNTTIEPERDHFGICYLKNGLALNVSTGTLYEQKGNIICGEDITDTVETIDIHMMYKSI